MTAQFHSLLVKTPHGTNGYTADSGALTQFMVIEDTHYVVSAEKVASNVWDVVVESDYTGKNGGRIIGTMTDVAYADLKIAAATIVADALAVA